MAQCVELYAPLIFGLLTLEKVFYTCHTILSFLSSLEQLLSTLVCALSPSRLFPFIILPIFLLATLANEDVSISSR